MDTNYKETVMDSVQNVFEKLAHVQVTAGEQKMTGRLEFISMESISGNHIR